MYTRKQYMNDEVSHREYYAQFVTPEVINAVTYGIGKKAILASTDEHMNDIPLGTWDRIIGFTNSKQPVIKNSLGIAKLLKEAGDGVSASTLISTMKECAKQIKEGKL